jgi:hypothetical protein
MSRLLYYLLSNEYSMYVFLVQLELGNVFCCLKENFFIRIQMHENHLLFIYKNLNILNSEPERTRSQNPPLFFLEYNKTEIAET